MLVLGQWIESNKWVYTSWKTRHQERSWAVCIGWEIHELLWIWSYATHEWSIWWNTFICLVTYVNKTYFICVLHAVLDSLLWIIMNKARHAIHKLDSNVASAHATHQWWADATHKWSIWWNTYISHRNAYISHTTCINKAYFIHVLPATLFGRILSLL